MPQPNPDPRQATGAPISLDDAEKIQRLLVKPMIQQVEARLEEHLTPIKESQERMELQVKGYDARMTKLESQQRKALWGWGAYCTVISAFIGWALYLGFDWVKTRLRGSP